MRRCDCVAAKRPLGVARALLRTVLHLAITEGPVLLRYFDQIDDHVLLAQTELSEVVRHALVERLFQLHCPALVQSDLYQGHVVGVVNSQVLRGYVAPLRRMARNHLELVILGYVDDVGHGLVDGLADLLRPIGIDGLREVDSYQWHGTLRQSKDASHLRAARCRSVSKALPSSVSTRYVASPSLRRVSCSTGSRNRSSSCIGALGGIEVMCFAIPLSPQFYILSCTT